MIPDYPALEEITIDMKAALDPLFKEVTSGISEFTFANIFLFRKEHNYRVTRLPGDKLVFTGSDSGVNFFMLPFGLPPEDILGKLFSNFGAVKNASCIQATKLSSMGVFTTEEDRANFDYIYWRESLATLAGRKYHKKRNLVKLFNENYRCEERVLTTGLVEDAEKVLEKWVEGRADDPGDYEAARDSLTYFTDLDLSGLVFYIDSAPVAYSLGEILPDGKSFITHFEKTVPGFRGLAQFVNKSFAAWLPEEINIINREQDLGDEGLRQAKESYRPVCFGKKYRVYRAEEKG